MAAVVQRDERRRRGLLPRQRVRWHRAARSLGRDGEPRRRATPTGCSPLRRVEVRGHVLRARLGRRAAPGARPRASPRAGTRSRRTATRIGWSTTRRPRRSATTCGGRRGSSRTRAGSRWSAIARRATRSRRDRCGRSTSWSRRATSTTRASFPIRHDRYGIPVSARQPYAIERQAGIAHRGAGLDHSRRAHESAGRRRRLFSAAAVLVDALGHRPGQPDRSNGRPSSTCIRGKSIRTSRGCPPAASAVSATIATSSKPSPGSGGCWPISGSIRSQSIVDGLRRSGSSARGRSHAAALRLVTPRAAEAPRLEPQASLRVTADVSGAEWDSYVSRHPDATADHLSGVARDLRTGLRSPIRVLAARRRRHHCAACCRWSLFRSRLFGRSIVVAAVSQLRRSR